MTNSRLAILSLLVLILVGICFIAGRSYYVTQTSYYVNRAEGYRKAGNAQREKDVLNAMVRNIAVSDASKPGLSQGNARLAQIYLDEAKAEGKPATYKAVIPAMNHLIIAAIPGFG
jgi:hypothetical protein